MAGICLIRLKQVRPRFLPRFVGVSSENAAHRIAVEWEQDGELRQGVYVPRRDTSSRFNTLVGGRLFPGVHHHARFDVQEQGKYSVVIDGDDLHLTVVGDVASEFPSNSIFGSLDEASRFFECGSVGYSPSRRNCQFEGLELRTFNWQVQPLAVSRVESSFFEDRSLFPAGSAEFDCALLMRNIGHEWHGKESLRRPHIRSPHSSATPQSIPKRLIPHSLQIHSAEPADVAGCHCRMLGMTRIRSPEPSFS
jgi:hypothetical protein